MQISLSRHALFVGIIIVVLGTNSASGLITPSTSDSLPMSSDWLYVGGSNPGNYSTIQEAVDAADVGDTVFIYHDSSPYRENVVVKKPLTLVGEDTNTTVIDGCGLGEAMQIIATNQVRVFHVSLVNGIYGVSISSCHEILVRENRIDNNRYAGIWLDSTSDTIIFDNIIVNNSVYGIWMDHHCSDNIINHNVIKNNVRGMFVSDSRGNIIHENSFIGNKIPALFIDTSNTLWNRNYWDTWVGLTLKVLRILPKCILGKQGRIPCLDYDFHPLLEPLNQSHYSNSHGLLSVGGFGKGNYTCVQDALDAAETNDMIFVYSGLYPEHLFISKSITLLGENEDTTILDGAEVATAVIKIIADRVNVSGFTLRHGGYGFLLLSSDHSIIRDNMIVQNTYDGIWLDHAEHNTICNNLVSHQKNNGLLLAYGSNENVVENNSVELNDIGVNIASSHHNVVRFNNFIGNRVDASFSQSNKSTWSRNYWERTRCLPKIILGKMNVGTKARWRMNVDWCPAKKPYDFS